jgi:hypothetical protein
VFGFDDLFLKIGNKYYFMVIFESYKNIYWILGYPFFKKYDIVFNEDSKTISYYTNNIPEENKGESIALKIVLIIFLALILVAGLIVLGYYIGKYKFFTRKRKANELTDDDYEYKEGGNIN